MAEAKLLQKYGGLSWVDPDPDDGFEVITAEECNMEFQGGRGGQGWCLIGTRQEDGAMEPWVIDIVIDLIAAYEQPAEMNVEVIVNEEMRAANAERIQEEKRRKNPTNRVPAVASRGTRRKTK